MKLKTIFQKISFFSILLCSIACFLACFNIPIKQAIAINDYDYSFTETKHSFNAKDIFTKLVGTPNELETDYLSNLDYEVSYSDNEDAENVVTSVIGDKLYVFAYESVNFGNNNKAVNWIPKSFSYKDISYDFVQEGDHYLGIADYDNNIGSLTVKYSFDAEIDSGDLDNILNGAFNYGKEQSETRNAQVSEYNEAQSKYEQYLLDLEAYNQNRADWDEYNAAYEAYNIYLNKYNEYLDNYAKYEINKAEWEQYNADYAAYTKYLAELDYYNANHEQNLEEYNNFYPNYKKFEYRLNAMNLIYKDMEPMKRNIYDQVMGDSVTQVLNQKSDLVALGVDEDIIDQAYNATLQLRTYFPAYKALETDEQKYNYYRNNYFVIRGNVEDLLRALDKLYRSTFVPEAIASMGSDKTSKYLNLIAQLAYLANAISDNDVYNYEGWNGYSGSLKKSGAKIINDEWTLVGKTWREYLEGEEFLDVDSEETKAYPLEKTFPTEIVVLLEEPEEVSEPVEPTEVLTEPVEPTKVDEPVKPEETLDKPEVVTQPKLEDYLTSTETDYLYADAYESGELVKHKEIGEKEYINFECSKSVNVQDKLKKVCRFLNYDGSYLYQDFFTSYPKYEGLTPYKEQDSTYNDYLFEGWNDIKGDNIKLESINNSCEVTARYLGRNLDKFDITFVIGDKVEVITCFVGYLPTLPKDISLPESNERFYVFTGWDKELELVHKADTYTAVFEEKNKYKIEFDIDGAIEVQYVKEGELPEVPTNVIKADTENYYYEFSGWDNDIEAASINKKYTALFDEEKLILVSWSIDGNTVIEKYRKDEFVTYKSIDPTKDDENGYYYVFNGWDKELGFKAVEDIEITAIFDQKRLINVSWVTNSETIVKSYKQDEEIIDPAVDSYFDECYIYTFSNFEKLSDSTKYDIHYVAKYNKDYILYSHNVGVRVYVQNNIINIYLDDRKDIDLSPLFDLFEKGYEMGDIKIIGNAYNIDISRLQLQLLINKGCHTISLNYDQFDNHEYSFKLDILDKDGKTLENIENAVINLSLYGDFDTTRSYVYLENIKQNAELSVNKVTLNIKPCVKYDIFPTYNVTILQIDAGEIKVNALSGRLGDEIVLEYTLNPGFNFEGFIVSETNGQICNISEKYTIKGYDITIGMSVTRIKYRMNYYVDGVIYATSYVYYGEEINPPENVSKLPTETTRFVFEGWDKNVERAYQDEDFVAIFSEVEIPKPPVNNKVSIVTIVEIIAISLLVIGVASTLLIIFRKKIFKKR